MKLLFFPLAAFFLFPTISTIPTQPTTPTPISIGVIAPLSGDAASYGLPAKQAIAQAVNEINASGGIDGRPIQVIYEDGKCSSTHAATAANKLILRDRVSAIIGGICSSETLAAAPIAEQHHIPLLSPLSSHPQITHAGDFIFRNTFSDTALPAALAHRAQQEGFSRMAILSPRSSYATEFSQVVSDVFARSPARQIQSYVLPFHDPTFESVLRDIKLFDPDIIVVHSAYGLPTRTFLSLLREQGISAQVYSDSSLATQEVIAADGMVAGMVVFSPPTLNHSRARTSSFVRSYVQLYGDLRFPEQTASAYDAAHIVAQAIDAVGTDGPAIRDYLYATEYDGVIGTYGFDANGDLEGIAYVVSEVHDGELVALP